MVAQIHHQIRICFSRSKTENQKLGAPKKYTGSVSIVYGILVLNRPITSQMSIKMIDLAKYMHIISQIYHFYGHLANGPKISNFD